MQEDNSVYIIDIIASYYHYSNGIELLIFNQREWYYSTSVPIKVIITCALCIYKYSPLFTEK